MTDSTQEKRSYKSTLNLPRTAFPMKANLVQNEPASMKRWADMDLYNKIRQAPHPAGPYIFHDGPPYANGSIHLGHLLNKVLKDIVVRCRTMAGFECPYVPGWDCHGLPIEHKVTQDLGDKARTMAPMQIRKRCQDYALKFVKLQSTQMQRLLTLADYEHPYLTLSPDYEAAALAVFAQLVENGLVYRALKPVHWSIANQTALAEAELEYEDREDTSVYVRFTLENPAVSGLPEHCDLLIWTTTPWTLPANLAVAVNTRAEYGIYPTAANSVVLAVELAAKVFAMVGAELPAPLHVLRGAQLQNLHYRHPFNEDGKSRPVVVADYVTLEDGTGLVHTAPGHGVEDYQTGLREGLDIYCPVLSDGTFDNTVPKWLRGIDVWTANGLVVEHLRKNGRLFHAHQFMHSYPHDWRSKTPTIFRATEQWFVSVDQQFSPSSGEVTSLRKLAVETVDREVRFIPDWGRNRMRGMLESRPDWCISRQRSWGLPIPALFSTSGDYLLTPASVRAVQKQIAAHGSDYWYTATPGELLADYDPAADPEAPDWIKQSPSLPDLRKANDIFDVWFDSGVSWAAVIRQRFGEQWLPTDLYLEGSDQHRGWFQASLLPALATTGKPPYKTVLTHGFMVDKDGRKMSKSLGNALEVETLLKDFGADVCRWWVSSLNTDNDIKVDQEFFRLAGEEYRKIRNTIRFLLSNLNDFDPRPRKEGGHAHDFTDADAASIDAWALDQLDDLIGRVREGYDRLRFTGVSESVFNFCNETMSAIYLTATKDRLYCDRPDSPRRRRTQSAMYRITGSLLRLIAPILPHTADEAWRHLHGSAVSSPSDGENACVHLALLPEAANMNVSPHWDAAMQQREQWLRAIEAARQSLGIDNPLDCELVVPPKDYLAGFDLVDLADLCGISRVRVEGDELRVLDLRGEPRCERSWKRDGTVRQRSDGGMLSDRDAAAVGA